MKLRLLALLLLLMAAAPVRAQSLFGTRGLGVPVDAIDPRARTLGNGGLGLIGLNTSIINPAELAGIRRRGVSAALQPFYGSEELGGRSDTVEGTRFPMLHILYPPRTRLVVGLGWGGLFDQSWAAITNSTQLLAGDTLDVQDNLTVTGALSQFRLSAGYELNSRLALGLAAGVYTGGVERAITRTFPDSVNRFRPFATIESWDYSAPFVVVGVRFDPSTAARISAALTWNGELEANARAEQGIDYGYDLPLRVAVGASSLLNSRLLATASAQWSGWSESANYAAAGSPAGNVVRGRSTIEAGGGLEWEQLRAGSRIFPLRVGLRYAQLPFHLESDEPAKEVVGSAGLGFRLAGDDFGPLAVADFGLERGRRTGWEGAVPDGLREDFWRLNFSITLFGR